MPVEKRGEGLCARCTRPIHGKHARYTMHDESGFKFTIRLHRSCAIAYANVLLQDNTRSGGLFDAEPRIRATLDALMANRIP